MRIAINQRRALRLRPLAAPDGSAFRFHVTSPPGESFATGVFPAAGAEAACIAPAS